jgi:hypothetical protein
MLRGYLGRTHIQERLRDSASVPPFFLQPRHADLERADATLERTFDFCVITAKLLDHIGDVFADQGDLRVELLGIGFL